MLPTAQFPNRSMEANYARGIGPLVKPIDILRNDSGRSAGSTPTCKYQVCVIWLTAGQLLSTPVIPLPHRVRVRRESLRGRELFWSPVLPQALRATKRRDTTRRRHPSTGNHGQRRSRVKAGCHERDVVCGHEVIVRRVSLHETSRYSVQLRC